MALYFKEALEISNFKQKQPAQLSVQAIRLLSELRQLMAQSARFLVS
jgi:hypothetical protein